MNFDEAFASLIKNEGDYVNNPNDPGGETRYGISKRTYPNVDIKNLTLEQAKAIYKKDFWNPSGCESVPDAVRFDFFDMAVNSGIKPAIRTLQKACGADSDGILGPNTLLKLNSMNAYNLHVKFNAQRLLFFTDLKGWNDFGKGWARRIANNLLYP